MKENGWGHERLLGNLSCRRCKSLRLTNAKAVSAGGRNKTTFQVSVTDVKKVQDLDRSNSPENLGRLAMLQGR